MDLITTLRVLAKGWWLGRRRLRSMADYQRMQTYLAEASVTELKEKGIDLAGSRVLELGAGAGGYSVVLQRESGTFLATDMLKDLWQPGDAVPFRIVDVLGPFPFPDDRFDLIYCSSLIEHIADAGNMLDESRRVLAPDGLLYLSFPPFYSLAMVGGHLFKPFHFFGERWAVRLTNLFRGTDYRDYATCFGQFGLRVCTIDEVREQILAHGFEIDQVYSRLSPVNTTRLPGLLKDLLTWHVSFLARPR